MICKYYFEHNIYYINIDDIIFISSRDITAYKAINSLNWYDIPITEKIFNNEKCSKTVQCSVDINTGDSICGVTILKIDLSEANTNRAITIIDNNTSVIHHVSIGVMIDTIHNEPAEHNKFNHVTYTH